MHTLAAAMITTKQAMTEGARSALPDAPVVPYVEKTPVGWRTRATVADALRHVADVVASPLVARRIKLRRELEVGHVVQTSE
jgi:hypothetical protein